MGKSGSDLFIVDNSDSDWKVHRYLHDWCHLSKAIDVATGFFEVGGLLALDGAWQTVPGIRILMGDEVSKRTKKGKPGRTLTDEDLAHYHKIVIALTETIRLMQNIDEVIESHGGWPSAFQPTVKKSD